MKKLVQFIKYNNAFTIIISLVMFSTAGAFANENVRETVIGQTIITKQGTDNTQIISANLDGFDMGLKIKSVKEDAQFYYVSFDYNAIDAKDGVWQSVKKEKNLNVLKTRLGDMDLGLYLAEELKQLTDQEMAYMKEVQSIEKSKGGQKQVESVEYTGLKGLVFDNRTKEIVGYEAVKEEENQKAEVLGVFNPSTKTEEEKNTEKEENEKVVQQITVVKETVSKETIMEMVKEAMAQEKGGGSSVSASSSSSSSSLFPAAEAVLKHHLSLRPARLTRRVPQASASESSSSQSAAAENPVSSSSSSSSSSSEPSSSSSEAVSSASSSSSSRTDIGCRFVKFGGKQQFVLGNNFVCREFGSDFQSSAVLPTRRVRHLLPTCRRKIKKFIAKRTTLDIING